MHYHKSNIRFPVSVSNHPLAYKIVIDDRFKFAKRRAFGLEAFTNEVKVKPSIYFRPVN